MQESCAEGSVTITALDGEASYGRRGSLRRHEHHGRQRRKQFVGLNAYIGLPHLPIRAIADVWSLRGQ